MIKNLLEKLSSRERVIVLAAGGLFALLLLLFMLDFVGGMIFALVTMAILAGAGLVVFRALKRDGAPVSRTSRAPTGPTLPLGKRILRVVGYAGFFSLCFFFFAYWTFPYDRVKDFIIQEVERPVGPGGRRVASGALLSIEELSPSFVTGVDVTGVRYTIQPDDPEEDPTIVMIEEASARVSLLSLITGGLGLTFDLGLTGGGTVEGQYEKSDTTQHIELAIADVNLLTIGVIRDLVGLPIRGKLGGTVDLTLAEEATETTGAIDLKIEGLTIGDSEAKFPIGGMSEGITIEEIDAGDLQLTVAVEEGVAEIEEMSTNGPDLHLAASGSVRLGQPVTRSRLDLLLRVKFTEAYQEKSNQTRNMFSLLELSPQIRPAQTTDGALQYRVRGAIGGRMSTDPAGREPAPGD
ncbi:MAG: type II secretion system protein GspN [Deltaproteobacteria bacterium]|nr:MAG: type II secretion system protein GspN [Deltaproteobacteria bacterium]